MRGLLAIVVRNNLHYGLARMYQAIAEEYREEVRVMRDLDEAIAWLGVSELAEQVRGLRRAEDAGRPGG